MVRIKIWRKFVSREKIDTPVSLANAHSTELFYSANMNTDKGIEKLKSWRPDVLISTNFSQYLGKRVRAVATDGTWNLHKSYLPHFRGMAPNFFALLESADFVGATLHVVDEGFDTGPILEQVKLDIEQQDTVYTLNQKCSEYGGKMMVEFLERVNWGNIKVIPQPPGEWKNYTYPSRQEIVMFRRKGYFFDRLTNSKKQ